MNKADHTVFLVGGPLDGDTWRTGDVSFSGERIVFSVWGSNEYYEPTSGQSPDAAPRRYDWAPAAASAAR